MILDYNDSLDLIYAGNLAASSELLKGGYLDPCQGIVESVEHSIVIVCYSKLCVNLGTIKIKTGVTFDANMI